VDIPCRSTEDAKKEPISISRSIQNESTDTRNETALVLVNAVGAELGEVESGEIIPAGAKKVVDFRVFGSALCGAPVTLKVRW
jgi:hypothetical protein